MNLIFFSSLLQGLCIYVSGYSSIEINSPKRLTSRNEILKNTRQTKRDTYEQHEQRILVSESYDILSKLYVSTSGSSWSTKTNWMNNANTNPCPSGGWFAITCSGSNVVGLLLYELDLRGTIPSEIGLLTDLEYMYLHYNTLTGTVPTELGMLTLSNYFVLLGNQLSGFIPSQLGELTEVIAQFYLMDNALTGVIPSQLGRMSKITREYYIGSNSLSGNIPSQLGQLTLLTSIFSMGIGSLTGIIPSQMGRLTKLNDNFILRSNSLSGNIPAS